MEEKKSKVKGKICCLTFNDKSKTEISGWLLLETDDGQEYIIQRNMALDSRIRRKVYQTGLSLKPYCIDHSSMESRIQSRRTKNSWVLGAGLAIAAVIRGGIPGNLCVGKWNEPFHFTTFVMNNLELGIMALIGFATVYVYRKKKMEFELRKRGGTLEYVGKAYPNTPMRNGKAGKEIW